MCPVLKAPLPIGDEWRALGKHFYRDANIGGAARDHAAATRIDKQRASEEPCDGDEPCERSAGIGVSAWGRFGEARRNIHQDGRRMIARVPHVTTIALMQFSP